MRLSNYAKPLGHQKHGFCIPQ